jgi:hypothetical protein
MTRSERLVNDLPSIIVIVLLIAAALVIRALVLRWYDRRLDAREAAARQEGDELLRDYRALHARAKQDPGLDATWQQSYHDEGRWEETAPEAPPDHW